MDSEFSIKEGQLASPKNLQVLVNNGKQGVTLTWEDNENTGEVAYRLVLNGEPKNIFSNSLKLELTELIAGDPVRAQMIAVDPTAVMTDSVTSNGVVFQIKGLIGEANPANWIGVRLDNITVIYEK